MVGGMIAPRRMRRKGKDISSVRLGSPANSKGRAIVVRIDYTSDDIRRVAQRVKNAAQARRLLAIAAVLDGNSREQAAKIGGMDRPRKRPVQAC